MFGSFALCVGRRVGWGKDVGLIEFIAFNFSNSVSGLVSQTSGDIPRDFVR